MTSGALIAFILYIDLFFSPVQQLSQVFDSWQQTRVSMSRVADLMKLETAHARCADPVDPGRLRGELSLESVRFAYPARQIRPGRPEGGAIRTERRGPADPRYAGLQHCGSATARSSEGRRFGGGGRRDRGSGGRNRRREIDSHEADGPLLRPGHGVVDGPTTTISARSTCPNTAVSSVTSRRRPFSSAGRSGTTSLTVGLTRLTPRWRRLPGR